MKSATIDSAIEALFLAWRGRVGDAQAAATLTLAQLQSQSPALPAISKSQSELLNLNQAAQYLGYAPAGLRKLVTQQRVQYTQNGRGPIRFRREWLDKFIAENAGGPQHAPRSPAQRRTKAAAVKPSHGFDPALYHADSHSGAA